MRTTIGFLSPSIVIIVAIAAFLSNFASLPIVVSHAFAGIRVCVCVLIFDAVVKLGKKSLSDNKAVILFLIVLALALFTNISTVVCL